MSEAPVLKFNARRFVAAVVTISSFALVTTAVTVRANVVDRQNFAAEVSQSLGSAESLQLTRESIPGELKEFGQRSKAARSGFIEADSAVVRKFLEKATYLLTRGGVVTHVPDGARVDLGKVSAFVAKGNGGLTVLRLPISGGSLVDPSSIALTFGSAGDFRSSVELHIALRNDNSAHATVWSDGRVTVNKIASVEGVVVDARVSTPTTPNAAKEGFWSKLNSCFSNAGIPWAVVAVISAVCGVACVVTVGALCPACLLVATGATNSTVLACIAQASQ